MHCTRPRSVSFLADGKTISWNPNKYSMEYAPFKLPCGKCIECRLDYARGWAVRCVHESKMHDQNCFITLTYSDQHLKSPKLQYRDFQLFLKRLRKNYPNQQITYFVTGEYGEKTKRPHWHAIIFGWSPTDQEYLYTNEQGDQLFKSKILDQLWGQNSPEQKPSEIGTVTLKSAGYVARYATKKLVHGDDGHEYEPISKKSVRPAIGRSFLERYYTDIFNYGTLVLEGGVTASIPRYYEKWLQRHDPALFQRYITIKLERSKKAGDKSKKDLEIVKKINEKRGIKKGAQISHNKQREKITMERLTRLSAKKEKYKC